MITQKISSKSITEGKKNKYSLGVMKGGQDQLTLIAVNTETAQRGCHDKVLHKRS